jgi:hypothetical protein
MRTSDEIDREIKRRLASTDPVYCSLCLEPVSAPLVATDGPNGLGPPFSHLACYQDFMRKRLEGVRRARGD